MFLLVVGTFVVLRVCVGGIGVRWRAGESCHCAVTRVVWRLGRWVSCLSKSSVQQLVFRTETLTPERLLRWYMSLMVWICEGCGKVGFERLV